MVFLANASTWLGEYRGDFWTFSFRTQRFEALKISYPGTGFTTYVRSNHSACYHAKSRCILLFGGSVGRERYNDLHILHVPTRVLRRQDFSGGDLLPRERTYHAGEILGDFMFIVGGESDTGDLQDMSVLDIEHMRWTYPRVEGQFPRRRFLTCTAIGSKLFLFGGCIQDYKFFEYPLY